MSLNIKDPRAHKLAKAIQRETGESMTHAVTEALQERLEKVQRQKKAKATAEELLEIGRQFSKTLKRPVIDHAEFLYDEFGLPK